MRISVINHSNGALTDADLQRAIRAVNLQLDLDFSPYWHRSAELRLEGHAHSEHADASHADMRGDAVIYIWDDVDPDGALGYHELTKSGIPYGFVFLSMAEELGEEWTVTFSHEVLEMVMDPEVNLLAAGPHPAEDREVLHWYEVCDAVQTQTYKILGESVSNFVLPLYFTKQEEGQGRNDFLGLPNAAGETLGSFGIAEGGYIGFFDMKSRTHVTHYAKSDQNAAQRAEIKHRGRGARRSERYGRIGQDSSRAGSASASRRGYKVEGPWNIGEPVHEVLALLAVKQALTAAGNCRGELLGSVSADALPSWTSTSAYNLWTNRLDRSVQQFVRGVIWPDDPECHFFDSALWTEDFSSGLQFLKAYKEDPTISSHLTARSHLGDLQFFHGMEGRENAPSSATQSKILKWSKALLGVATGDIDPNQLVSRTPFISRLFTSDSHQKWTIRKLFGCSTSKRNIYVKQRAAGALLHMIQDSCAPGHVTRESDTLQIRQFLVYGEQSSDSHSAHDVWQSGRTLADRVRNTPGAAQAVAWSSRALALIDSGKSVPKIMSFLEREVFTLADETLPAGPGEFAH